MFVVYSNNEEVIVTTEKREKGMVKSFFTEGGRDIEKYDRRTCNDEAISVTSKVSFH